MNAYLDNAATGFPKNTACLDAMREAFLSCANSGRGVYEYASNASEVLFRAREAVAGMFGGEVENVVMAMNATHALNMAIKGLYRGGSIVISDLEHNAVLRPARAISVRVRIFHVDLFDDAATVRNFKRALEKDTSLVAVTHASNVCGRILPVKEICHIASENGISSVVDASQTAGHFPIDIRDIGCTALCFPGHKGLYAPTGTGVMLVSKDAPRLKTLIEGGTGSMSLTEYMPEDLPERMEAGTQNICMAASLAAAIENFVYPADEMRLFAELTDVMRQDKRFILYGAPYGNISQYVPVLAFNYRGVGSEEYVSQLASKGIALRGGFHCSPLAHASLHTGIGGSARISIGKYNTSREIHYFLEHCRI